MLVKYFQSKSFSENLEPSNIKFSMRVFGFVIDILAVLNVWHPIILPIYHYVYPFPSFLRYKTFHTKNAIFKSNNVKIHKKCENQTEDIPKPEFSKKNLNPGTLKSSQIWIC